MKFIFHASGSSDCPLLVLTDLQAGDVSRLQKAIAELARGDRLAVPVDDSFGVIGDIRVRMELGDRDVGILGQPPHFACSLTASTWDQIEGLLDPFADHADGDRHQWLDDSGEVSLLISTSGMW